MPCGSSSRPQLPALSPRYSKLAECGGGRGSARPNRGSVRHPPGQQEPLGWPSPEVLLPAGVGRAPRCAPTLAAPPGCRQPCRSRGFAPRETPTRFSLPCKTTEPGTHFPSKPPCKRFREGDPDTFISQFFFLRRGMCVEGRGAGGGRDRKFH